MSDFILVVLSRFRPSITPALCLLSVSDLEGEIPRDRNTHLVDVKNTELDLEVRGGYLTPAISPEAVSRKWAAIRVMMSSSNTFGW